MKYIILFLILSVFTWSYANTKGEIISSEKLQQVGEYFDDICGDVWCEGEFNYHNLFVVTCDSATSCAIQTSQSTHGDDLLDDVFIKYVNANLPEVINDRKVAVYFDHLHGAHEINVKVKLDNFRLFEQYDSGPRITMDAYCSIENLPSLENVNEADYFEFFGQLMGECDLLAAKSYYQVFNSWEKNFDTQLPFWHMTEHINKASGGMIHYYRSVSYDDSIFKDQSLEVCRFMKTDEYVTTLRNVVETLGVQSLTFDLELALKVFSQIILQASWGSTTRGVLVCTSEDTPDTYLIVDPWGDYHAKIMTKLPIF